MARHGGTPSPRAADRTENVSAQERRAFLLVQRPVDEYRTIRNHPPHKYNIWLMIVVVAGAMVYIRRRALRRLRKGSIADFDGFMRKSYKRLNNNEAQLI